MDHSFGPMRVWCDLLPDAPRETTLAAWTGLPPRHIPNPGSVLAPLSASGSCSSAIQLPPVQLQRRLREGGRPAFHRSEEMTYLTLQSMDDERHAFDARRYWKRHYLPNLPDAAIEAFLGLAGT
jgi:hypothetical protein